MTADPTTNNLALEPLGFRRWLAAERRGSFMDNLIEFCSLLRERGFSVGPGDISDALRAVSITDLDDWQEFYLVLKSLFPSRYEELLLFETLFHSFWTGWRENERFAQPLFGAAQERPREARQKFPSSGAELRNDQTDARAVESSEADHQASVATFSPEESLLGRVFASIDAQELRDLERPLRILRKQLWSKPIRRTHITKKGHLIDIRRTMRHSVRFGGEVLSLSKRKRRIRRLNLVMLLDVSRSMDVYSSFLLKLIYSLHRFRGRTESFVFGTDLKRVTPYLRIGDVNLALLRLSEQVPFWSGGTRIGHSFRMFNLHYASTVLTHRTVMIILSDGLDVENAELVADELGAMRQKIGKLIWLNPLIETPGYQPLAGSMAAALPFIDVFTSVENLAGLDGWYINRPVQ